MHLMLSERVIEAVASGRFSVYAIATVNEALELLTGKEPGKMNTKGKFPKGTLNDRIMKRLEHFAKLTRQAVSHSGLGAL
jgi:predicted ATP-dependent protease